MTQSPAVIIALALLPFGLGVVLYATPLSRRQRRNAAIVGLAICLGLALLWTPDARVSVSGSRLGLSRLDQVFVALFTIAAGVVAALGADTRYGENFASIVLLTFGAVVGVVLAEDVLLSAFCLQLASITTVFVIPHRSNLQPSTAAALRYLILTFVGAGVLIAGLTIASLQRASPENTLLLRVTAVSIAIGLGLRVASAPLHVWLPPVSEDAPPLTTAAIVALVNASGLYLLQATLTAYPQLITDPRSGPLFATAGAIGALVAALVALADRGLRRFLAWGVAYDVGFVISGLASASGLGWLGATLATFHHAIAHLLLFSAADGLDWTSGDVSSNRLRGLARHRPATATALAVGAWSMLGMPPLAGFIGRWPIYASVARNRALLFMLLAATATMLLAAVKLLAPLFAAPTDETETAPDSRLRSVVLLGLSVALVGFGLYPEHWVRMVLRSLIASPFFGIEP